MASRSHRPGAVACFEEERLFRIIDARDEKQLIENIGATGWSLTAEQNALLEQASDVPPAYPVWHQRRFAILSERGA